MSDEILCKTDNQLKMLTIYPSPSTSILLNKIPSKANINIINCCRDILE